MGHHCSFRSPNSVTVKRLFLVALTSIPSIRSEGEYLLKGYFYFLVSCPCSAFPRWSRNPRFQRQKKQSWKMAFQLQKLGFKTKQSSVCHLVTVNLGKWYDPWALVSWAVEKRTPLQDSAEDQWVVCIKPPSHPSSQCTFVVDQLRWSWVPSCPAPMLKEEECHRASRYERFWPGNGWGVVLARERPAQLYSGRSCQAQSVWFSVFESRKFRQNPGGSKEVLFGWRGPFSAPEKLY